MIDQIKSQLYLIRKNKPLILNITNYVTMDFMANCLLALGAAPIMSEDIKELEEMVKISGAININIGTLTDQFMEKAIFTCHMAKKHNKPVILDPVAVGASKIRSEAVQKILPFTDIIRGNASEIIASFGFSSKGLGVENNDKLVDAIYAARELALLHQITVIVSGATDFITNGKEESFLPFGSELMSLITGAGCSLTAIIAAFRSVMENSFEAARLATSYFGLTGQISENHAKAPASFKVQLIDNLYHPNWNMMEEISMKKKILEKN